MKKDTDRIRRWRERQKAEGKTSFTILLSQEARGILAEEKGKTGESYAVIVEKALQTLKKENSRPSSTKTYFSKREEIPAKVVTVDHHQRPGISVTSNEKLLLVDDLVNYSSADITREQAQNEQNGIRDFKFNEGLVSRLFRASATLFGHKKKTFRLELRGGKAFKVSDD